MSDTDPRRRTAADHEPPPVGPPHRVRLPVNLHRWERITFLHWRFDPEAVARLVPPPLEVLTYDSAAWVGVTPFVIRVRLPGVWLPEPLWRFPETNVRTYVTLPDGKQGLWFLRMEVPALWFLATLRSIGLPYHWQRMAVRAEGGRLVYVSQDVLPPRRRTHAVVVRPGAPLEPSSGGPFERYMTARWGAYHRRGPLLMYTPADHPPWALHHAEVEHCDAGPLLRRAGLPPPDDPPVALYSPGVPVRIGHPRLAPRRSTSEGAALPYVEGGGSYGWSRTRCAH